MALDQRRYEDEVVKPLRTQPTALPDDLVARYAVEPGMTPPELERRLREVRAYWHNKARSATNVGQVCKAFVQADEKLRARYGEAMHDPTWWRQQADRHAHAQQATVRGFADDLRASHGFLGALTESQLAAEAAARPGIGEADARRAAAAVGLAVLPARELPHRTALSADAHRAVVDGLAAAQASSIPALLHPGCTDVRLLDGFAATPAPAGGLDADAVTARYDAEDKASNTTTSGPTKHVLGRLRRAAVEQGVDLRELALVHVLTEPRRRRGEGAGPAALVQILRRAGIADDEARRIVVHLLAETAAATDPLEELRGLLAEGQAVAASRLVSGLRGEHAAEGRTLVDARNAEIDALRAQAADAVARDRPDLAEQKLRAAREMAVDRTDLAEELARLPLVAVRDADASADGAGARVSWVAPTSHREDTHYRVVRRADRAPRDADDGEVVATVVGRTFAPDPAPPVGRTLHYAVLAGRGPQGPWSSPTPATVRVVPPVSDLEIVGEEAAVVGGWTAHPDVARVRVRRSERPPGPGVPTVDVVAGPRSFTDTAVVAGTQYHYELVAIYAAPDGGHELRAAAVVRRSGVRVPSAPVVDLEVDVDGDELEPQVLVRWRTPPGAEVVIRAGRTPPPGEPGERVAEGEVEAWGAVPSGVPRGEGDWTSQRVEAFSGRRHYAAFTRGPSGYVRGAGRVLDLVRPPRQLRAQRRGDGVVLSWLWPDDVRVAEVSWPDGSARLTLAQYREQGGLTLRADVAGTVEVRSVVGSGPDRSVSTPAGVDVDPPRHSVRYTLRPHGSRLLGRRKYVVSIPAGQGRGVVEVVVVAAPGRVMPLSPAAGAVIAAGPIPLDGAEPGELHVPWPSLRKPYWLRCFSTTDGIDLIDPPPSDLKVS